MSKTTSFKLAAAIALLAPAAVRVHAVEVWTPVIANGFGLAFSTGAGPGFVYNDGSADYIYFGTNNSAYGAGLIRSLDGASWTQVNSPGYALSGSSETSNVETRALGKFSGYLYAGTAGASGAAGAKIFRSQTGVGPWSLVFSSATTGSANEASTAGSFEVYLSRLFTGTANASGGSVWFSLTADAENSWSQSNGSFNGFGQGTANSSVNYLKAFSVDGALYAASSGTAKGRLWRTTDGTSWANSVDGPTTFSVNTYNIPVLEEFNGMFYAGTGNAVNGAQLWRSATPSVAVSWAQVYSGDGSDTGSKDTGRFALATSTEVHAMSAIAGALYVNVADPATGARIYRSNDGATWVLSTTTVVTAPFVGGFAGKAGLVYTGTSDDASLGTIIRSTAPDTASPSAVSDLASLAASATHQLQLTWTAPGNDGSAGTLLAGSSYYIQLATFSAVTFSTTTPTVSVATANAVPGSYQSYISTGLEANTTYFAEIWTADPALNWSAASNLATRATLALPPATLGTTFLNVFFTSATAAWAGFPTGVVSSQTAEGYIAEASTTGFNGSGTTLSSATKNVLLSTLTVAGLAANSTYYFRVESLNWVNALSTPAVLGSTVTRQIPPGAQAFSNITSSGIRANWDDGGNPNPSALTFTATLSTGPFSNTFSGNVSSVTFSTFSSFGLNGIGSNLTPNTTYFAQVNSTTTYWPSPTTSLGSTATLANAPVASSATVYFSSITLSWLVNGNPSGTTYYALLSTGAAFTTLSQSATTQSDSVWLTSLAANTTYYGAVYAKNHNGIPTAYALYTVTSTFVSDPGSASPSGTSTSALTVNWTANGNSPTTVYTVKLSSDGFITAVFTATTTAVTNTFSGLTPNTLYQSSVSALGNNSASTSFIALPSTYTFMLAPGVNTSTTYLTVDISSLTLTWNRGSNPVGTLFVAQISSGALPNAFSGNLSSYTYNTSVLLGAGGEGPNLSANTSYYCQVFSSAGVNTSAYVSLGSTSTLAAEPTTTTITAVSSNTVTLTWAVNGNPLTPGTTYELWIATDSSFSTPVKVTTRTAGYFATGLTALTTYYFKPRARNFNGITTLFDVAASTLTTPPQPGTPGTPTGTAVGVSSISWAWSLATNATSYNVFIATNTSFFIGSSSFTGFVETGLAPNTTNSIVVRGVSTGGPGAASSAGTAVYTLAMPPINISSPTVKVTSAVVTWGLNGNPSGLTATVERSTDNAAFASVYVSTFTTFTDTTLLGCSTYFYRVKNTNGGGIDTGYASSLQFNTQGSTPLPAGTLSAASVAGNLVSLTWTASPFEGITRYRLFYDAGTETVSYAAPLAVFTSTETSYTTGVLSSTAAYIFALRATNRCGIEETTGVFAVASSTAALSTVRAAISSPQSGTNVGGGNALTVTASLSAGTSLSVSQVVFQYKAVAASTWTVISTSTLLPYTTSWNIAAVPLGSYNLRAVAYDVSGAPDSAPGAIAVNLISLTSPLAALPGFTTETVGVSSITKTLVVSNMAPNTIAIANTASDGTLRTTTVLLPAGAFGGGLPNSTGTLTLVANSTSTPAAPDGANAAGIGAEITLTGANLSGQALLTFSYSDPANSGLINGVIGADALKLFSYSTALGKWINDLTTTVDTTNHAISGLTSHFSFFAGFGLASADLANMRVYPNPWKPNGTSANEGKPFVKGDPTSGIIFDRLPGTVVIKIYTMSGQPVAKFSQENGPGVLQWDGQNDSNHDVASGLYVAVISGPGIKTVTKKLLIIR